MNAPGHSRSRHRPGSRDRCREAGFSLIELMVSMAIGLVVTVAIASVMISSENDKRGSTAINDVNQSGGYAAYLLDRQIRSAGSGFAQAWSTLAGCTLYAQNTSGQVLPLPSAGFTGTSPFINWTAPVTLAPVIIGAGLATAGGGDLLMVMTGTGGIIEQPSPVLPSVSSAQLRLLNTLGFRDGDLVLIGDTDVAGKCMVQQVAAGFAGGATQSLPFGGAYAAATIGSLSVTSYATGQNALAAQIGNFNDDLPQFSLIGVGANATLFSADLLPAGAIDNAGQSVADGVVEMRAIYGVTTPGGVRFVGAGSTNYSVTDLTNPANAQRLKQIVAIRLGLILRTSIAEAKPVYAAGSTLKLFDQYTDFYTGASLSPTPRAIGGPPYYRYRSIEMTIPLRNVMAAP